MLQASLDLDHLAAEHSDRVGFDLGWDHAHHGLVPPVELMLDGTPLRQGWAAGRAVFGSRTLAAGRPVRQWLALRLSAWREGVAFEGVQITPNYLAQLQAATCPVTLRPLGGAGADAALIERLRPGAAYAAGHLATLSAFAAATLRSLGPDATPDAVWARSRTAAAAAAKLPNPHQDHDFSQDAGVWQRLAVLLSFVTPMPHTDAARLPLVVMPPNRVRVLNPIQSLQVVLTWQLAAAGWSARLREVASLIEAPAARHEFLLFVGALAPRVMALPAGDDARIDPALPRDSNPHGGRSGSPDQPWGRADALRHALGRLWTDERVQRRWLQFALAIDEATAERLATRAAALSLKGRRALVHAASGATDGWADTVPAVRLLRPTGAGQAGTRSAGTRAPRLVRGETARPC